MVRESKLLRHVLAELFRDVILHTHTGPVHGPTPWLVPVRRIEVGLEEIITIRVPRGMLLSGTGLGIVGWRSATLSLAKHRVPGILEATQSRAQCWVREEVMGIVHIELQR